MQKSLADLYQERGRLRERIAYQRVAVATSLRPLTRIEIVARQALALLGGALRIAADKPWLVGTAVAGVVLFRPRRVWRMSLRAFALWRGWRRVRVYIPVVLRSAFVQALRR